MHAASAYLAGFAGVLRRNGFLATTDQTIAFLTGVTALGPGGIGDIRQAALACFGPGPDRRSEFDALFRGYFHGDTVPLASADAEEEILADSSEPPAGHPEGERSGDAASAAERLQQRSFAAGSEDAALRRFAATVRDRLPRRKTFRSTLAHGGRTIDLRGSLRQLPWNDGDIPHPVMERRALKIRNVLVLVDVSGSMKGMTDRYLGLCHALMQAADGMEVFTFATRLSRITPALKLRDRDAALAAASTRVADWDGGTRIGPCLLELLTIPRYAGFARGAAVLVISDGMERGDVADFVKAVWRLSRLAFRLTWATPLASDSRYEPRTRAMRAILPALDDLIDGSSIARIASLLLDWNVPGPKPATLWTVQGTHKDEPRRL